MCWSALPSCQEWNCLEEKKCVILLIPFFLPLFVYACARSQAKNLRTWHRSMYHYTICTVANSQIRYELIITTIMYQPVVTMFLWHRRTQSTAAESRRRVFRRLTFLVVGTLKCELFKVVSMGRSVLFKSVLIKRKKNVCRGNVKINLTSESPPYLCVVIRIPGV